uniref:Rho/rac guanine nucleotide exchange factor (GEF) 18b n=1 Tax=Lepisosteus oculatus TaxID=7918 RepID=W5M9L5_LEPOC
MVQQVLQELKQYHGAKQRPGRGEGKEASESVTWYEFLSNENEDEEERTEKVRGATVKRRLSSLKNRVTGSFQKDKGKNREKEQQKEREKEREKEKEPKEKRRASSGHQFVPGTFSSCATCTLCSKTLVRKNGLQCLNCAVNVHKSCKNLLAECSSSKAKDAMLVSVASAPLREQHRSGLAAPDGSSGSARGAGMTLSQRGNTSQATASSAANHTNGPGSIAGEMDEPDALSRTKVPADDSVSLAPSAAESIIVEDGHYAALRAELEVESQDLEAESWSLAVDPQYLKKHSKDAIKRQDVIYELIQTEIHHVRTLKIMLRVYVRGMRETLQMDERKVEKIFPCVENLLDIHRHFLARLKDRRKEGLQPGSDRNYSIHSIGDVLTSEVRYPAFTEMQRPTEPNLKNEIWNCRLFLNIYPTPALETVVVLGLGLSSAFSAENESLRLAPPTLLRVGLNQLCTAARRMSVAASKTELPSLLVEPPERLDSFVQLSHLTEALNRTCFCFSVEILQALLSSGVKSASQPSGESQGSYGLPRRADTFGGYDSSPTILNKSKRHVKYMQIHDVSLASNELLFDFVALTPLMQSCQRNSNQKQGTVVYANSWCINHDWSDLPFADLAWLSVAQDWNVHLILSVPRPDLYSGSKLYVSVIIGLACERFIINNRMLIWPLRLLCRPLGGSIKKTYSGSDRPRERSQRASSDPQLKEICCRESLEQSADEPSESSWTPIWNSCFPEAEFFDRVLMLSQRLYSLQAIVSHQDSCIELQRASLPERDRPGRARGNVLLEQEKQRNFEKQREELAHFQKLQGQLRQEQRRWERERESQRLRAEEEEARLRRREEEGRRLQAQLEQQREELEQQRLKYQQDLERLRESAQAVEREKERLEQQQKRFKKHKTIANPPLSILDLRPRSAVTSCLFGWSRANSPKLEKGGPFKSLVHLQLSSGKCADYAQTCTVDSNRKSPVSSRPLAKTEVPIHLISTTNQLHKQAGVQQQIPTKLALSKGKEKGSKGKASHRTDSSAATDRKQILPLKLSGKEEGTLKGRRSVSPNQNYQQEPLSPPDNFSDGHPAGIPKQNSHSSLQTIPSSSTVSEDVAKEDVIFF